MTTLTNQNQTREQWLTAAAAIILDEHFGPVLTGFDKTVPAYRVSLTSPSSHTPKKQVQGECWHPSASEDNTAEIFITASKGADDSGEILSTLVHELVHLIDRNESGHGDTFQQMGALVGLEAGLKGRTKNGALSYSWTCTEAGDWLKGQLHDLVHGEDGIGVIPHAALNPDLNGKPKQKNRQLLVKCSRECGFQFRTSQKNIDSMRVAPKCLSCDNGHMFAAD